MSWVSWPIWALATFSFAPQVCRTHKLPKSCNVMELLDVKFKICTNLGSVWTPIFEGKCWFHFLPHKPDRQASPETPVQSKRPWYAILPPELGSCGAALEWRWPDLGILTWKWGFLWFSLGQTCMHHFSFFSEKIQKQDPIQPRMGEKKPRMGENSRELEVVKKS